MRDLVRPTLFMIARLGLFFAVVTWIVGQRWRLEIQVPRVRGSLMKQGWLIWPWPVSEFSLACDTQAETPWFRDTYEFGHYSNGDSKSFWGYLGVGADRPTQNSDGYLSFRHWLIVTVFALFNGVLMWVYRKRGKELAR